MPNFFKVEEENYQDIFKNLHDYKPINISAIFDKYKKYDNSIVSLRNALKQDSQPFVPVHFHYKSNQEDHKHEELLLYILGFRILGLVLIMLIVLAGVEIQKRCCKNNKDPKFITLKNDNDLESGPNPRPSP